MYIRQVHHFRFDMDVNIAVMSMLAYQDNSNRNKFKIRDIIYVQIQRSYRDLNFLG